jgi:uncharacterized zinc-type alcohol dehydrogenase-like protein
MIETPAYATFSAASHLAPFSISRREPGAHDVLIDILYCGVCHSDIHQVRNEWGGALYPMVPGHEIAGTVAKVGKKVERWKVGDAVGVGSIVDSCRKCEACRAGEEQLCAEGMTPTYNGYERDGVTPTFGGYSARIAVNEDYVLRLPAGMPLEGAAPLLCAGITTYSPLRRHGVKAGDKIAVAGLGGLGHMAVKIARALGAEVTVLSHTPGKRADALRMGAEEFVNVRDERSLARHAGRFDFLLDTIPAQHDYGAYLNLLRRDATMVVVGVPDPAPFSVDPLVMGRRCLAGSLVGGIRETQEMLDFCAKHGLSADVEVIPARRINEAFERILGSDVRFRFVIDAASLKPS